MPAATTDIRRCCWAQRVTSLSHATSLAPFISYFKGIGGAKAMLEDGLFERFPCDSVFGMHNRPDLPIGKFAIRPGPMMAGGAFFDITVTGKGSHGARPEEGIDPVLTACHITTALQAIVSRNLSPRDRAVLSVTTIQAGDAYNVIPVRRAKARSLSGS